MPCAAQVYRPGGAAGLAHISLDTGFMDDLVDLVGRYAGFEGSGGNVQDFSCQPADFPHLLLRRRIQEIDLVCAQGAAGLGDAVGGIVWVRYRLGHFALLRERVDRAQRAREGEGRERVVVSGLWIRFRHYLRREEVVEYTGFLLVHGLVRGLYDSNNGDQQTPCSLLHLPPGAANPVLLEAVLGAEEAVLDAELQARRTLQRASVVGAVDAETLLLGRRFYGHGFDWRARRGCGTERRRRRARKSAGSVRAWF